MMNTILCCIVIAVFTSIIVSTYYAVADPCKKKMNIDKAKRDINKLINLYANNASTKEIVDVARQMEDGSNEQSILRSVYLRCDKGNYVETEVFTAIIICLLCSYGYWQSIADPDKVMDLAKFIYDEDAYEQIENFRDLMCSCAKFSHWSIHSKLSGEKKRNGDKLLSEITYSFLMGGRDPHFFKDIE